MCFNPIVSFATAVIECVCAAYVFGKKPASRLHRLGAVLLVLLAVYQVGEFMLCRGILPQLFVHVGYGVTALLPALGIHLGKVLMRKRFSWWWYAPAGVFGGMAFATNLLVADAVCHALFVEFLHGWKWFNNLYGLYYAVYLVVVVGMFMQGYRKDTPRFRPVYRWGAAGVLIFVVPTFVMVILVPGLSRMFGSILCHFALLFAMVLVVLVEKADALRMKL